MIDAILNRNWYEKHLNTPRIKNNSNAFTIILLDRALTMENNNKINAIISKLECRSNVTKW